MSSTWSTPQISDQDFYTGIGFAVINKRANRAVTLGKKYLHTKAKDELTKDANERGNTITHPYLDLIRSSVDFSERDFWYDISTYLDLEGVYYLMAVRTVRGNRVGNIQKFVLLNPYNVKPVVNQQGELGGYVEQRGDKQRNIPKEMIIPIRLLNPFENDKAFALADAARDAQFTLKQANDFAREAIDGNLNAPGILSSAIELPDDQFDNFVDRIKNHGRGEPLFGNGAGTVSWVDMQQDLDKAALDKINSINRDTLISISGLSTSGMGLEQPGTGREVSRTQKDDFTENAIMPQIENIIDALNLDYRKHYASEWSRNGYYIALSNPLETDKDAEQADVNIRDSQFGLMQEMIAKGYPRDIAAKYAKGLIDVVDLGEIEVEEEEPKEEVPDEVVEVDEDDDTPEDVPQNNQPTVSIKNSSTYDVYEGYPVPVSQYLGDHADQIIPASEEVSFVYVDSQKPALDKKATVTVSHLEEKNNSLIGVVDENTFLKLGEFKSNADKPAILTKLNKRYKNQPVAIKKKIELKHTHAFNGIRDENYEDIMRATMSAEDRIYDWYVEQVNQGVISPHADIEQFIDPFQLSIVLFFSIMYPIYGNRQVAQTARQLGRDDTPIVRITDEVRETIENLARRDATSHVNTIKSDIEGMLANIRARTSNIEEILELLEQMFREKQQTRAETLSNHVSNRIRSLSMYESDLEYLNSIDELQGAYKVLHSTSGDPCPICEHLIAQTERSPIPFDEPFVNMGEEVHVGGHNMRFDFEAIESGSIHVNCRCVYRLVFQ